MLASSPEGGCIVPSEEMVHPNSLRSSALTWNVAIFGLVWNLDSNLWLQDRRGPLFLTNKLPGYIYIEIMKDDERSGQIK